MNDKELLTLAAKAAGIELLFEESEDWPTYYYYKVPGDTQGWNPLNCDGDALRLAVKLELEVCTTNVRDTVTNEVYGAALVIGPDTDCFEKHKYDPYAATRRAIVRAAAEIGRGME